MAFGTSVQDPAAMGSLVRSIASAGVSVLATVEPGEFDVDESLRHKVHAVGFAPLARLLPPVDVVVSAGGTGTLLAALALGKPQVIPPFIADQPWNARRAADRGIAVEIEDLASAGDAVRQVISDPSYARTAKAVAEEPADPASAIQAHGAHRGLARLGHAPADRSGLPGTNLGCEQGMCATGRTASRYASTCPRTCAGAPATRRSSTPWPQRSTRRKAGQRDRDRKLCGPAGGDRRAG
ncbi:glycosyltransferase [Streptomyces malaysiensis subsp. malaysiensis]|nr:nucleotide disphospho-sugar-binding domain-containing protein [Streptomyces sp. NA07423]WHX15674.1 glycosyltransferase [Streptomyces sp. NA07423]